MGYVYRGAAPRLIAKGLTFDPKKCGTYAGYKQHQNHGTEKCSPCKRANSEHVKAFYARKKAEAA
jgi:hypothetical protein